MEQKQSKFMRCKWSLRAVEDVGTILVEKRLERDSEEVLNVESSIIYRSYKSYYKAVRKSEHIGNR